MTPCQKNDQQRTGRETLTLPTRQPHVWVAFQMSERGGGYAHILKTFSLANHPIGRTHRLPARSQAEFLHPRVGAAVGVNLPFDIADLEPEHRHQQRTCNKSGRCAPRQKQKHDRECSEGSTGPSSATRVPAEGGSGAAVSL